MENLYFEGHVIVSAGTEQAASYVFWITVGFCTPYRHLEWLHHSCYSLEWVRNPPVEALSGKYVLDCWRFLPSRIADVATYSAVVRSNEQRKW